MKNRLCLYLFLALLPGPGFSHAREIPFIKLSTDQSWDSLQKVSLAIQKPLLILFYSDSCLHCTHFEEQVLTNPLVERYISTFMIPVKVNGERNPGSALTRLYQVKGFPTLLFCNGHGELLQRITGYTDPAIVITSARAANESYFADQYTQQLEVAIQKSSDSLVNQLIPLVQIHFPPEEVKASVLGTWKIFYGETGNVPGYERTVLEGMTGEADSAEYLYEQAYDIVVDYSGQKGFPALAGRLMDRHLLLVGENYDACYLYAYICTLIPDVPKARQMANRSLILAVTPKEKELAEKLLQWIGEMEQKGK